MLAINLLSYLDVEGALCSRFILAPLESYYSAFMINTSCKMQEFCGWKTNYHNLSLVISRHPDASRGITYFYNANELSIRPSFRRKLYGRTQLEQAPSMLFQSRGINPNLPRSSLFYPELSQPL